MLTTTGSDVDQDQMRTAKASGSRALVIAAVLASVMAAGCGGSPTVPLSLTVATDSVSSGVNMHPAPGTVLELGQTVTFSGTPGYTLASADLGTVIMVVQDQANQPLPVSGPQPIIVVRRGTGDVTLTETVTLPAAAVTTVRVFFVLAPAGAASTSATVAVSYPVR